MNGPIIEERNYIAFISYRHLPLDREAAIRIQKKIENYVVPKDLREKAGGKKLGICFRDEDELPASSSLSDSITYALDHSQYLIVVCTPDLPKSKWCLAEVSYFLRTHDRDHVLAVLADGTPEESFPEQLRFTYDDEGRQLAEVEPLAANIAGEGHKINNKTFKKEVTRLIAAMLGCPFDALWQRERRAKTNRLVAAMGVGVAAMAVVMGIVLSKNAQISRQNAQILEQNEQIEKQNTELQRQMSSVLVDSGRGRLEAFDPKAAVSDALKALESNDPSIYDHRAERLLADSLGAYEYQQTACETLFRQSTDILLLAVTEDGSTAFTADEFGTVRAVDAKSGRLLWEQAQVFHNALPDPSTSLQFLYFTDFSAFYPIEEQGLLLCKSQKRIAALSIRDGNTVWTYEAEGSMSMQVLSKDKTLFSTVDSQKGDGDSKMPTLLFFDTAAGEIVSSVLLEVPGVTFTTENACYNWGGAFSDDDRLFFCAAPAAVENEGKTAYIEVFSLIDVQNAYGMSYSVPLEDKLHAVLTASFISPDRIFVAMASFHQVYTIVFPLGSFEKGITHSFDLSLSSQGGSGIEYIAGPVTFLPALYSDDLAVLFHHDNIFMVDLRDGSLRQSFKLASNVVAAIWGDQEEGKFVTLDADGTNHLYDYAVEDHMAYDTFHVDDANFTNLSQALLMDPGDDPDPESSGIMAVLGFDPGAVITIKDRTDPSLKALPESPIWEKDWKAVMSPSGRRLFVFSCDKKTDSASSVTVFDAETGELLTELPNCIPPDLINDLRSNIVTDDEHFLHKGTMYDLKGNATPLCDSLDDSFTRVLPDGTLLFGRKTSARVEGAFMPDSAKISLSYQLGGDAEHRHQTVRDSIVMEGNAFAVFGQDEGALFTVGSNGWLAGCGNYVYEDTDGEIKITDAPTLVVQNALSGEKTVLSSSHDGQPVTHLVMGNQKPILACVYEDGAVMVFDLTTGECKDLHLAYTYGEVFLACFSDRDDHLLIYSSTGRLDCIRMDTCERVFSENGAISLNVSAQIPDRITALELPDRQRMVVYVSHHYYGNNGAVVLDTEAWTNAAEIDGFYTLSAGSGQVYVENGTSLSRCPLHSVETLADWARAKLEQ